MKWKKKVKNQRNEQIPPCKMKFCTSIVHSSQYNQNCETTEVQLERKTVYNIVIFIQLYSFTFNFSVNINLVPELWQSFIVKSFIFYAKEEQRKTEMQMITFFKIQYAILIKRMDRYCKLQVSSVFFVITLLICGKGCSWLYTQCNVCFNFHSIKQTSWLMVSFSTLSLLVTVIAR